MSYPIDIQSVKGTKLFKKFMESKNKSMSAHGPRIENVDINVRPITTPPVDPYPHLTAIHKQQPISKPVYSREQFPTRRNVQPAQIRREYPASIQINFESSQRKTQNNNKERIVVQDESEEKKFEKLLEEYDDLKSKVATERKETRKQMIKLEEQADLLSKKVFELRSREDQLILQNKRLKQKSASEQKQRIQMEEANRQLQFQIQQLRDMLDGQQNSSKKREDQTSHWKKINDDLKQRIRQLELEVTRLRDSNNMMEREKCVIEKQIANKQSHLNEMREKIHSMIAENGVLRDEIFLITGKLYSFEQENKSLKADLKRHSDDFPMSYLQEQLQQARSSRPYNTHENSMNSEVTTQLETIGNTDKRTERRRGEFARQRGLKKIENPSDTKPGQQQVSQQLQTGNQNKDIGQTIRKLEELNEELQKLKDMKAMNGTMRRQKINLQRQILELEEYLKSKQ